MKKLLLTAIILLCASSAFAGKSDKGIKGSVRCDGKGIAGVVVSDGVNLVRTDGKGCFQLPFNQNPGRFVFISTPSGYISGTMPGHDCFYQEIEGSKASYDFRIAKNPLDDNHHKVIVVADPQVSDADDLSPLEGRLDDIAEITAQSADCYTFGISLGDIVGWDHSLYPRINRIFQRSNIGWRNVIGNHDMTNYGRSFETSTRDYENTYGPTYYSFNVGKVHYIVLNDNFFVGKDWYYIGYLSETQLSWLEKDLSCVAKGSEVVVCMHIPSCLYKVDTKAFSYPDIADILCNNTALYKMLDDYEVTILSGHMHTNSNVRINDHIVEHNIGGLCGAWWCGDVCIDGCPPGCKVYERDGRKLSWYYKGEGLPADFQFKVYVDSPQFPGEIVAHVWDQDKDWKVEYWENGTKICDMQNFEAVDPHARDIFSDASQYKIFWVTYFKSPNFFKVQYNKDAVNAEVRVTDPFGRVFIQKL